MTCLTAEEARAKSDSYSVDNNKLFESVCGQISTMADFGHKSLKHAYSKDKHEKSTFDFIKDKLLELGYRVEVSENSITYNMEIFWGA